MRDDLAAGVAGFGPRSRIQSASAADSGQVDETDTEYLASLWRNTEPFYIAPDHARPEGS